MKTYDVLTVKQNRVQVLAEAVPGPRALVLMEFARLTAGNTGCEIAWSAAGIFHDGDTYEVA